jgi:hypothetical protein
MTNFDMTHFQWLVGMGWAHGEKMRWLPWGTSVHKTML